LARRLRAPRFGAQAPFSIIHNKPTLKF
jgi:hypothetical protein